MVMPHLGRGKLCVSNKNNFLHDEVVKRSIHFHTNLSFTQNNRKKIKTVSKHQLSSFIHSFENHFSLYRCNSSTHFDLILLFLFSFVSTSFKLFISIHSHLFSVLRNRSKRPLSTITWRILSSKPLLVVRRSCKAQNNHLLVSFLSVGCCHHKTSNSEKNVSLILLLLSFDSSNSFLPFDPKQ